MIKLFTLTQIVRERPWRAYLVGAVAVGLCLGLRLALGDLALKFPFVLFIPAVVLTTFVGGLRAGIASALLAGIAADLTLIAPTGRFLPDWPDGWVAMGFYVLTVTIDIALIHAMTTAFRRAAVAEAALRRANEGLETTAAARGEELRRQVAEKEAAEAQVRQMQKTESVGQITGGIAHDFNNMLGVVIGSLEMARRRIADPRAAAPFIDNAEEAAKRASELVKRLLAYSRRQPLAPQALDANRLVSGMSELMRRTIGEQVQIDTILAGGLWPCFADPAQVENAILNLAVNARDAMPGGGRLTIETGNTEVDASYAQLHPDADAGQYVRISVTDSGTGMTREVLERAFDPFFTTKDASRGSGLGLSQVYGFARQSGGHVTIYSEVGRGTTVRLHLPRHTGVEAAAGPRGISRMPSARPDEMVLVVEDEDQVRRVSVDALRELGYTVIHASDGRQALEVLTFQPRINVLFTDVVMPEMDGRQLAEAARALRPDLLVLYTTGYARNALPQDDGPDLAVLPKPFTLSQLAEKMRDVLDRAPN